MGFDFRKIYNAQAKFGTALNRKVNKVIGKDVFGDINEIEEPRVFEPYENFANYNEPEPAAWQSVSGEDRTFVVSGSTISVCKILDYCLKYRSLFSECAKYYTEQFKFKYNECVTDFDSFINYFPDMYLEGLVPLSNRACDILLSLGLLAADAQDFVRKHTNMYHRAYTSYCQMQGIETQKNAQAEATGDLIGNSIQMQGGGFGFKGAMKGMAQAEAFNIGIGLLGKFVSQQNKMTSAQKAEVWEKFNTELFFEEVYDDYCKTFLTLVKVLIDAKYITNVKVSFSEKDEKVFANLQNPMFPQDKVIPQITQMITNNPFVPEYIELLRKKVGDTEEVMQIVDYFSE